MENGHSFDELLAFLGFVGEKGLMSAGTAKALRVAAVKMQDVLSADELADVRLIDLATAFQKVANRSGTTYAPATLQEYERRAGVAIQEFVEWNGDRGAYRPRTGRRPRRKASGAKAAGESQPSIVTRTQVGEAPTAATPPGSPVEGRLQLPFPLRPGFLAAVTIPTDLTTEEARRLGAFIVTLAVDYRPQ